MKNTMAKTRPASDPYEVWVSGGGWTWNVLKKWQADDNKPYARWFCFVTSPFCPEGEYGDVYVSEIKAQAEKVDLALAKQEKELAEQVENEFGGG